MTKNKRFYHKEDDWEIFDGENHLAYAHSDFQAEKICKLLNELHEENKNLSKLNKILEGFLLDKGYDFKDIIKFIQERTDGKGDD